MAIKHKYLTKRHGRTKKSKVKSKSKTNFKSKCQSRSRKFLRGGAGAGANVNNNSFDPNLLYTQVKKPTLQNSGVYGYNPAPAPAPETNYAIPQNALQKHIFYGPAATASIYNTVSTPKTILINFLEKCTEYQNDIAKAQGKELINPKQKINRYDLFCIFIYLLYLSQNDQYEFSNGDVIECIKQMAPQGFKESIKDGVKKTLLYEIFTKLRINTLEISIMSVNEITFETYIKDENTKSRVILGIHNTNLLREIYNTFFLLPKNIMETNKQVYMPLINKLFNLESAYELNRDRGSPVGLYAPPPRSASR